VQDQGERLVRWIWIFCHVAARSLRNFKFKDRSAIISLCPRDSEVRI
jgi:hypothetical protein